MHRTKLAKLLLRSLCSSWLLFLLPSALTTKFMWRLHIRPAVSCKSCCLCALRVWCWGLRSAEVWTLALGEAPQAPLFQIWIQVPEAPLKAWRERTTMASICIKKLTRTSSMHPEDIQLSSTVLNVEPSKQEWRSSNCQCRVESIADEARWFNSWDEDLHMFFGLCRDPDWSIQQLNAFHIVVDQSLVQEYIQAGVRRQRCCVCYLQARFEKKNNSSKSSVWFSHSSN